MDEQALRQAFVAVLPDRIVGLEMAYEGWRLAQQDATQALEQFCRLSHNLAGMAALYGFEQISAPCRALECYLRVLMRDGGSVGAGMDAGEFESVARLLAEIRGCAKQVWQESGRRAG